LATEAPVTILDEPTANLDQTMRGVVLQLVAEASARGRTVLFSSHVLAEVEEVCDRVAFLRAGRLAHLQVMAELRRRHRIRAVLRGPLPPPPAPLDRELVIRTAAGDHVTIETPVELSPLLAWLATLPIAEAKVEPVGLRAIYDQLHDESEAAG